MRLTLLPTMLLCLNIIVLTIVAMVILSRKHSARPELIQEQYRLTIKTYNNDVETHLRPRQVCFQLFCEKIS